MTHQTPIPDKMFFCTLNDMLIANDFEIVG